MEDRVPQYPNEETRLMMDRGVESRLMLCNTDTGDIQELERFPYLIEAPQFRTENELLFNSKGCIFRYLIREKKLERIDTGYCTCCNNDHVLSADGTRLAVSHITKEDLQSRIYIIDLLRKSRPPFLVTPLAPSYLHGWSPDGKELAFCGCRNGRFDLYTIPAEGGEEKLLLSFPGHTDGVEYAPDGRTLFFNGIQSNSMDCYRLERASGSLVRLTHNGRNNWFPHISPNGDKVIYLSYDSAQVPPSGLHPANLTVQLRAVSPDGQGDWLLTELFGGQGTMNVNSWSPDNVHAAFVAYTLK